MKTYKIVDNTVAVGDGKASGFEICFLNANNIEKVIIPATVKQIGYYSFNGCDNLKEVVFEERSAGQTLELAQETFSNCGKLSEITLPGTLVELHDNSCENVTIYFDGTEADWNNNVKEKPYDVEEYNIIFKK